MNTILLFWQSKFWPSCWKLNRLKYLTNSIAEQANWYQCRGIFCSSIFSGTAKNEKHSNDEFANRYEIFKILKLKFCFLNIFKQYFSKLRFTIHFCRLPHRSQTMMRHFNFVRAAVNNLSKWKSYLRFILILNIQFYARNYYTKSPSTNLKRQWQMKSGYNNDQSGKLGNVNLSIGIVQRVLTISWVM